MSARDRTYRCDLTTLVLELRGRKGEFVRRDPAGSARTSDQCMHSAFLHTTVRDMLAMHKLTRSIETPIVRNRRRVAMCALATAVAEYQHPVVAPRDAVSAKWSLRRLALNNAIFRERSATVERVNGALVDYVDVVVKAYVDTIVARAQAMAERV